MKKVKNVLAMTLAVLMLLGMVACAGSKESTAPATENTASSNESQTTAPATETETEEAPAEEPAEVVEITVYDEQTDLTGVNVYYKQRQDEFDELYGDTIKVTHLTAPSGADADASVVQSISTLFMNNDKPAFYKVTSTFYAKDLYNLGMAADISAYVGELAHYDSMYESCKEALVVGDQIIGIPEQISGPMLAFRRDALEAAGYDPDTFTCETWDDYYEVAKKMTTDEQYGASIYAAEYFLWPYPWFMSNGAEPAVQNADGTITLDFTDEEFVDTIEFLRKLYQEGLTNPTVDYASLDDMMTNIFTGKVASFTMYPGWSSWFAGEGVTPDNVKLVSYPAGPSGTSWGAIYSGAFVFNPTLSEAELKAAIKYVDFVWSGYDRWVGLGEYRVENGSSAITVPCYSDFDWLPYAGDIPADWVEGVKVQIETGKLSDVSSTAWTNYLLPILPKLITDANVDIIAELEAAQATCTSEWLDDYNAQFE